jgi:hypothetical protein
MNHPTRAGGLLLGVFEGGPLHDVWMERSEGSYPLQALFIKGECSSEDDQFFTPSLDGANHLLAFFVVYASLSYILEVLAKASPRKPFNFRLLVHHRCSPLPSALIDANKENSRFRHPVNTTPFSDTQGWVQ